MRGLQWLQIQTDPRHINADSECILFPSSDVPKKQEVFLVRRAKESLTEHLASPRFLSGLEGNSKCL